jgi:MFS family permease
VVAAASAMLPFVALMFALSPSAGRLMDRLGPRPLLIIGPLMTASGYLLMTRIMADGTYLVTVLPAVVAMSLGMALSVAPLTATVMKSAGDQRAGVASGINNAVSRLASLLAVGLVGMFTTGNFGAALASTSIVAAGLAIAGAGSAAVLIRDE